MKIARIALSNTYNYTLVTYTYLALTYLKDFEMLEVSSGLSKEIMKDIKLILVDFIYKFKDKKYKYTVLYQMNKSYFNN